MKEMLKRPAQKFLLLGVVFFLVTCLPAFAEDDPAKKPPSGKETEERFVSIDFNNVDISVFIKFISELTGTNFIIDDTIKGKVTIISPSKISETEAYKVFESVLEVHGFATVKAGEVVKIVSAPEARTKSIETLMTEVARNPNDKLVTQLITLKYADPDEVKRMVAPLISKNSVMLAYEPTGTLIVTDAYSNIRRLMQIIKSIDVADVGQNISVIPLMNADATKVAQTLDGLFKDNARRKTPRDAGKVVKVIPDERTNSIILLASEVDTLRMNDLIAILDKEVPKGKDKIHVYYLENSTAEEVAKVLQSLSGKQASTGAAGKKGKAEEPLVSDKVMITSDKATNSLIIMADKDEYMVIEGVIKKLDIPRSMVYIECLIVEISVNKSFNIGAEWTAGKEVTVNDRDGGAGVGFSGGSSYSSIAGLAGRNTNAPGVSVLPEGFALGVVGESLKIGDVVFPNLGAVISAMQTDKDSNILSTPQLLTTDNEEASITVGSNVPYKTSSGTSSTAVETYSNYDYKNVGKILKITPQISKDRQIRLKINFESTEVDTAATGVENYDTPTTKKRAIETTVIVKDNNTVVLGGLIDKKITNSQFKVPCVGSIPILGYLFKSMTKGNDKSNLYVFLTPHVVGDKEEAAKLLNRKKGQIEALQKEKIKLYDDTETEKQDRKIIIE